MTDAPSWLTTEEPVQDVKIDETPAAGIVSTQSATSNTGSTRSAMEMSGGAEAAEADAELPRMILFMRLANLGVAGAMIACSVSFKRGVEVRLHVHSERSFASNVLFNSDHIKFRSS